MDVPQNFATRTAVWLQKSAFGSLIVAGYFYCHYLLTRKHAA